MLAAATSKMGYRPSRSVLRLALVALVVTRPIPVAAQDRTSEAGEASIKDPNIECSPYYYPAVNEKLASFPPIWQPATILANDTNAKDKWASIAGTVPSNVAIKQGNNGDFSAFRAKYNPSDPDCWWTWQDCTTPKAPGLPADIAEVPEPMTMGYGFDDGPNCSHNAFYDYMQEQNQKATMFFIGSNVLDWPLEAQRALTDGHEICVHTWSHRYMTTASNEDAFAELYYSLQAIKLVVGVTPTCWRPPYGDVDDRIRAIAHGLGLQTIMWKYDSSDWKAGFTPGVTPATVDGYYQDVIDDVHKGVFNTVGAIQLTHELNNFTMSEAVKYHSMLRDAFKYLMPVGVALNKTQPYVENTHSLPTFAEYVNGTIITIGGPPQAQTTDSHSDSTSSAATPSGNIGTGTNQKIPADQDGKTGGAAGLVGMLPARSVEVAMFLGAVIVAFIPFGI